MLLFFPLLLSLLLDLPLLETVYWNTATSHSSDSILGHFRLAVVVADLRMRC
jgi:hypothetical protein